MRTLIAVFLLAASLASGKVIFKEPEWWDRGVVFVGNWEPLNVRLRYGRDAVTGGELPVNVIDRYMREHSEETVLKLKEAGVNLIIAHFYKMGLEADREEIELTRKLGELCHKHGMKLGVYIGDTIYADTMLRDNPKAREWLLYMENGDSVRYGGQTFRHRVDFNHPGYVEHIKNVIRVAVEEVKADLIHFDNVLRGRPPFTGNTPEINRRFHEFLRGKYTPEQLKQRFGFSDISNVRVPSWSGIADPAGVTIITDPMVQEWTDFRCHDLADYYGKLAAHIRSLNPNVIVELNPHGINGSNRAFLSGVDHARLVQHGSVFWTEEANDAEVDPQGILVSKIRSLKVGRSLNRTVFIKCRFVNDPSTRVAGSSYKLRMAEAMAFNRNCLGDVGKPLDVYEMPEAARSFVRFYHEQNRLFQGTRNVADVAVLRSFASMAYNSVEPHRDTMLIEQVLIQNKVPFDIIFDQQIENLGRYKAVILGSQECLPEKAIEKIREYVRNGGGLVATGHTSLFTDWRRVRREYALSDVLGIRLRTGRELPMAQRRAFGKGRAAYIPTVVAAKPLPPASTWGTRGFDRRFWHLPRNAEEIMVALRYAAGSAFSVEFTGAPLTTVAELTEQAAGTRILHWINYKRGAVVPPVEVTMAVPEGRKVGGVEAISPDREGWQVLEFQTEGGRIRFRMPQLETYNLAVVTF
ncbi:MAG: beta-galactosidase trimerization domain-containing protein [Bryobacteraceae bacterium]|nr:beta-galactosidase trimerization domain-containing protein [Bryobacterales bacterium]NUN01338.1 beta-galactosidase trimerization domain-containing protein [Bryobacteraceae bacterium]